VKTVVQAERRKSVAQTIAGVVAAAAVVAAAVVVAAAAVIVVVVVVVVVLSIWRVQAVGAELRPGDVKSLLLRLQPFLVVALQGAGAPESPRRVAIPDEGPPFAARRVLALSLALPPVGHLVPAAVAHAPDVDALDAHPAVNAAVPRDLGIFGVCKKKMDAIDSGKGQTIPPPLTSTCPPPLPLELSMKVGLLV